MLLSGIWSGAAGDTFLERQWSRRRALSYGLSHVRASAKNGQPTFAEPGRARHYSEMSY